MTMPFFDTTKAYAPQEEGIFFDDGREIELLHYIYARNDLEDIRGRPHKVLAAIDEYGRTKKYLMNVGEDKGRIVTDVIREAKPKIMVELGGYIGYSCILFASTMRDTSPGEAVRYFTLERNPEFGAVISSLVDLAGLRNVVHIEIGSSEASLQRLHATGQLARRIDLMFLDHYKPAYVTDLKLCEELGLVRQGTVLCADNVISPGNPPYLEYVRMGVEEKQKAAQKAAAGPGTETGTETETRANGTSNGHVGVDSRFAAKNANQYSKRVASEKLDVNRLGNPALEYESKLVHSFEPTGEPDGIEITRCLR